MSPSPAGGWVFVKTENVSESGCFYSSQIGFSTSRDFDISEALWKHRRAVLFVGVLLKKRFLPTSYSPVDFLKMSFLVYIGNNYLSHPLGSAGARLNHCTQPMTQLCEAELQT